MNQADKWLTAEQCLTLITKWETLSHQLLQKAAAAPDIQATRRLNAMVGEAQAVAARYRRSYNEKVNGAQP